MRIDSKIVLVVSCALVLWGVHIFKPEDTITYAQPQMTPAVHSYGKVSSVGMDVQPHSFATPTSSMKPRVDVFHHRGPIEMRSYQFNSNADLSARGAYSAHSARGAIYQTSSASVTTIGGSGGMMGGGVSTTHAPKRTPMSNTSLAATPMLAFYSRPIQPITTQSAISGTMVHNRWMAPGLGQSDLGAWVEEFVDKPEYGWNYSDGTYEYFDLATLKKLFDTNGDGNITDGETIVIDGVEYSWSEFLVWWNDHENNLYYRTPLDGEWVVLLVLACAYVFAIYVRRRRLMPFCTRARVGAHRSSRNIAILLFVLLSISTQAQDSTQYIDPQFGDTIDRRNEDFVKVSLLVADPGMATYSVFGHACLRMQCPAFGMDYCFSYESEGVENRSLDYLAGKLKMGMFAIPVEEYCATYIEEGRAIYEYPLNLPIAAKQELWRILDEAVAQGIHMPYDYYQRGCAITCVRFVEKALGNHKITYSPTLLQRQATCKERVLYHCEQNPWASFVFGLIAGGEADQVVEGSEQLCIPSELVQEWQQATLNGQPLLGPPSVLVPGEPQYTHYPITPMICAIVLLLLSIANLWWKKPYWDWCMLAIQTAIGLLMTYLIVFSDLCCTSWNWLLIPFNILPALAWYWRHYWAMPYAILLAVWTIAMSANHLWGHPAMDWAHITLVAAYVLVYLKQKNNIKSAI